MGASHCGADGLFERQVRRLAQRAKNAGHARRLLAMAAELDGSSREEAARVGGMDRQMRVGQKNKLTYRCARKARAPAPRRINARSRPICLAPSAPSEAPSETINRSISSCTFLPDRDPDELVWKHLRADTVGRMTITEKADFKARSAHPCAKLQNDPEKIPTKNHRSNMPPDSAFTYGLINRVSGGRSKASRTASSDSPVGFIITASLDPGLAADCYV